MENWRFIKENNDYMVSDHGRIMSLKKPQKKILSSSLLHNGYEAIYIYQKGIHAARYYGAQYKMWHGQNVGRST